jgi:cytochrome c biogenesis protein CcmG/thiol:disulfide interchange protein DsbE
MRYKISAGDLLSAESILEVHRAQHGEDGAYLVGLSWLARGALLIGDLEKAKRYAAETRTLCEDRTAHGGNLEKDHDLEIAWGGAVEVETERIERTQGKKSSAAYVRGELARIQGPVALRSRLNKRLDLLTLAGAPAPELEIEDFVGERPPTLASLRGRPVLLFLWAEWCSDCKAQAAALAKVRARHAGEGLQVVAVTRYYDDDVPRLVEKARVDSVWKAVYADVGTVPLVISTASMVRYGCSSTPTFAFVDRKGVVSWYTPTRLTEAELERAVATIVR